MNSRSSSEVALGIDIPVWSVSLILFIAVLILGCNRSQRQQYVVVHVLRDPSASFAAELSRADLEFGASKRYVASGKPVLIATNESSYFPLLKRFGDSPFDLLIFDSEADIPANIRPQLSTETQVCGHHPAFVPTVITGDQREAAQGYLQFLASNCK